MAHFCHWAYTSIYDAQEFSDRSNDSLVPAETDDLEGDSMSPPFHYYHNSYVPEVVLPVPKPILSTKKLKKSHQYDAF